jgi:hypothetical protein
MSLWVMVDDSDATDELLAGAAVAAIAATVAEVVTYQSATRFSMRVEWLAPAVRLPADVVRDTWIVFAALYRMLVCGQEPHSGFVTLPFVFGGDTPEGMTRRFLVTGARSLAPNAFLAEMDARDNTIVVHELVRSGE